jgi:hypothetical protein
VYDILVALKERFAPTDYARKQEYTIEWRKICASPKRGTDIDNWLQRLETLYDECKTLNIPEVEDPWPLHSFLSAINAISPSFSDLWEIKVIEGDRPDFHWLVSKFREYRSITSLPPKAAASHSAFEATLNGLNQDGQKPKVRNCLCGQQHLFIDCPYLMESIRKPGWNPKADIKKKVDEGLEKGSDGVKAAVARAREKLRKGTTTSTPRTNPGASPETTRSAGFMVAQATTTTRPGGFMLAHGKRQSSSPKHDLQGTPPKPTDLSIVATCTTNSPGRITPHSKSSKSSKSLESSVFKVTDSGDSSCAEQYRLYNSFILDPGATCHVCNDKSMFTKFRPASEDILYAGKSTAE